MGESPRRNIRIIPGPREVVENHHVFIDKPSISMGHLYHGELLNNHRILACCHGQSLVLHNISHQHHSFAMVISMCFAKTEA